MDDFNSETDSDYTSYWRDWVSVDISLSLCAVRACSATKAEMLRKEREEQRKL